MDPMGIPFIIKHRNAVEPLALSTAGICRVWNDDSNLLGSHCYIEGKKFLFSGRNNDGTDGPTRKQTHAHRYPRFVVRK